MKLAKCLKCGELIDLDLIEPLDLDTVIGCGLKEGFLNRVKVVRWKMMLKDVNRCETMID